MPAPPPSLVRRRACRTGSIATARTCVHHLPGSPRAAVQRTLFFVLERRSYALRTSTSATTFRPRSPVAISASTNLRRRQRRRRVQLWPRVFHIFLRDPSHVARWAALAVPCPSPPILS